MPRPHLRTNFLRKIRKRLPGGGYIIHYKRRNSSVQTCAECKAPLQGTPKGSFTKIKNIAITVKRPTRVYGGNICASCAKKKITQRVFEGKKQ